MRMILSFVEICMIRVRSHGLILFLFVVFEMSFWIAPRHLRDNSATSPRQLFQCFFFAILALFFSYRTSFARFVVFC